ncbi:MAG: cysteinyl-tRNA synthetase [Myxococcota bacterium]|jgi:cysteinyl-tRNA synthetase
MSALQLDITPGEARRSTVHDAWRTWRATGGAAPETPPAVTTEVCAEGPTIRRSLELYPAEAVRWALLAAPAGAPLDWSEQALGTALADVSRLYEARHMASRCQGDEPPGKVAHALGAHAKAVHDLGTHLERSLARALNDGFDTAAALAALTALATAVNRFTNHKQAASRGATVVAPALDALSTLADSLGLLTDDVATFRRHVARKRLPTRGLTPAEVQELVDGRRDARRKRDWARADTLRERLDAAGVVVVDTPGGSEWRVRT